MRPSKKADRAMAGIAELLKKHGYADDNKIEELKDTAPTDKLAISRQGEAVLLFLESPAKFTTKQCKRCGEYFGTNYRSVGYCSDNCRARAISEQLGVKWDWLRPEEERWGGEPPLVIPPAAIKKLQEFTLFFAAIPQPQNQTESLPNQEASEQEPLLPPEPSEYRISLDSLISSLPQDTVPETPEEDDPFDFS